MRKEKGKEGKTVDGSRPKLLRRTGPLPWPEWETEILNIDELAKTLQLSKKTIYSLVKAKKIPATRIGNK